MKTAGLPGGENKPARKPDISTVWAITIAGGLALSAAMILSSASLVKDASAIQADNAFGNLQDGGTTTLSFDAALGTSYYQNSKNPRETRKDPLAFSAGDTFFQDGAFYPEGTIPPGSDTFDVHTPGAIGTYNVRGTWITDLDNFNRAVNGDEQAAPAMAFATEIFTFGNDGSAIMTDGMYPNAHFSARRVVLGGTGRFRGVVGEMETENIGETQYGCNFRLKFKLRRAGYGARR